MAALLGVTRRASPQEVHLGEPPPTDFCVPPSYGTASPPCPQLGAAHAVMSPLDRVELFLV